MQIFVFGDSITYGASDREGGWVTRLRRLLDEKMYDSDIEEFYMIYNLGISGNNTSDLLERFQPEIERRIDEGEKVVVVFAIGINDSQYIGSRESPQTPIGDFEVSIGKLFETAKRITPIIVFVGLTNVDESRTMPVLWSSEKFYDNKSVQKYNSTIEEFCKENQVKFVSLFGLLSPSDLDDGLHPNTSGHEKIFARVRDALGGFLFV